MMMMTVMTVMTMTRFDYTNLRTLLAACVCVAFRSSRLHGGCACLGRAGWRDWRAGGIVTPRTTDQGSRVRGSELGL